MNRLAWSIRIRPSLSSIPSSFRAPPCIGFIRPLSPMGRWMHLVAGSPFRPHCGGPGNASSRRTALERMIDVTEDAKISTVPARCRLDRSCRLFI